MAVAVEMPVKRSFAIAYRSRKIILRAAVIIITSLSQFGRIYINHIVSDHINRHIDIGVKANIFPREVISVVDIIPKIREGFSVFDNIRVALGSAAVKTLRIVNKHGPA